MISDRLEVFNLLPVSKQEGVNLSRAIDGPYTIKADRYSQIAGGFKGRLILTDGNPREIIETSPEGFVTARGPYDF